MLAPNAAVRTHGWNRDCHFDVTLTPRGTDRHGVMPPRRNGVMQLTDNTEHGMSKPTEGNIKGAQEHAEGQHGQKTRERLQELNATGRDNPDPTEPIGTPVRLGKHRITEDREQHDEGEKRSELEKLESMRASDPFSTPQGRKS
jgi:hypothetical protein